MQITNLLRFLKTLVKAEQKNKQIFSSSYLSPKFTPHYDRKSFRFIVEAGARDGNDSLQLAEFFQNAILHSFECNPLMIRTCRDNLDNRRRIIFNPVGLGSDNEELPFYAYTDNNPGASSFYKRIDFEKTQSFVGTAQITTIEHYVKQHKIPYIDLLCMDVQGFELNIIKGCGNFIKKIGAFVLEEPRKIISTDHLPPGTHSKYINSPKAEEISEFLNKHGFIETERAFENEVEDNVLYMNTNKYR
jgi:FkbM family methyltransferase